MKVVSLIWYKVLPPLFGGQKGIAHFNRHLAEHCELTCLCSADNFGDEPYRVLPQLPTGRKHVLNPFYWAKVSRTVKNEKAQFIILEHPYHGIAAWLAARFNFAKLIVHSHNIESNRFRKIGKWWWRLLRAYEKWTHRRAHLSLFKTKEDLEWAVTHFGIKAEKCIVIPYGIDPPTEVAYPASRIRDQYGLQPEEKLLLFAGTLDYEPNAKAVEDIYSIIAPALRAAGLRFRIIICGRNRFNEFQYLKDLQDPSVTMAGEVSSIDPFFRTADVFINPVLSGGGIQTKTIDAIANGCNTVCFGSLATGIPKDVYGNKLRIAPDKDWDQLCQLIVVASQSNPPTPAAFFSYFDWQRILQPLIHNLQLHE